MNEIRNLYSVFSIQFLINHRSMGSDCVFADAQNEGEENFVGDSEIIALGGASNETKDRPLG